MKRSLLRLIGTAVCAIAVAGGPLTSLADARDGTGSPTLDRISKRGELVVGMTGEQPPFNMVSKKGPIIGLDADLARAIASGMGVKMKVKRRPFGQLLAAVAAGDVDMVISSVTITPERNMQVAFVGPYYISGKSILTKSKTLSSLNSTDQINQSSFTFAALAGSTSQIFAEELLSNAKLITTKDYEEATRLVREGKADALVADLPYCIYAALRDPKKELDTLSEPLTFEPLGIALPPNDPLFVNLVENALATMEGTGALERLRTRWFQDDSWLAEIP